MCCVPGEEATCKVRRGLGLRAAAPQRFCSLVSSVRGVTVLLSASEGHTAAVPLRAHSHQRDAGEGKEMRVGNLADLP